MPPKRASRPARVRPVNDDWDDDDIPSSAVRQRLAPLPNYFSKAYGAPLSQGAVGNTSSWGSNLKAATRELIKNVQKDNQQPASAPAADDVSAGANVSASTTATGTTGAGDAADAAAAAAKATRSRRRKAATPQPQRIDSDSSTSDVELVPARQTVARATPKRTTRAAGRSGADSTPAPAQHAPATPLDRSDRTLGTRDTTRSFVEESNVFRDADVHTPIPAPATGFTAEEPPAPPAAPLPAPPADPIVKSAANNQQSTDPQSLDLLPPVARTPRRTDRRTRGGGDPNNQNQPQTPSNDDSAIPRGPPAVDDSNRLGHPVSPPSTQATSNSPKKANGGTLPQPRAPAAPPVISQPHVDLLPPVNLQPQVSSQTGRAPVDLLVPSQPNAPTSDSNKAQGRPGNLNADHQNNASRTSGLRHRSRASRHNLPQQAEDVDDEDAEDAVHETLDTPWGYVKNFFRSIHLRNWLRTLQKYFASLAFILCGLILLRILLQSVFPPKPPGDVGDYRINRNLRWYGWNEWSRNLGQFVPYSLMHPLGALSDDEFVSINAYIKSLGNDITILQKDGKIQQSAVDSLEKILPRIVHVKKDGRGGLVVPQEFWHALKELAKKDKEVLTLENVHSQNPAISDIHWNAIKGRLESGAWQMPADALPSDAKSSGSDEMSRSEVQKISEQVASKSWESWLKQNEKKVGELLRPYIPDSNMPRDVEKQLLSKADKIIKDRLNTESLTDALLSREDFVKAINKPQQAFWQEIRVELEQAKAKMSERIDAALKVVNSPVPSGLTKNEVVTIVENVLRKSLSNSQLEALAKGNIAADWRLKLSHQINMFGLRSGSLPDARLFSPTWRHPAPPGQRGSLWGFYSSTWAKFRPRVPIVREDYAAPFDAWAEDGDCWCAAVGNGTNTRPADVAVQLGHLVIPQQLVIEHIDPRETLDPLSMPREIEVWAHMWEAGLQARARDLSASLFASSTSAATQPGAPEHDTHLLHEGFAKIGVFEYEPGSIKGGVQVFQLTSELLNMGAAADRVVIRAVSNYGTDHTCFYRVRLYGELRDENGEALPKDQGPLS